MIKSIIALASFSVAAFATSAMAQTADSAEMMKAAKPVPKVVIFDVNETLLDLEAMRNSVGEVLGGREDLLPYWFSTMLHYSLVDTLNSDYRDFADVGAGALMMVAERENIALTFEEAKAAITGPITSLPAHPDVEQGLQAIQKEGYRIVSLTNSSNAGVAKQFENAGLTQYFEKRLSVEDVRAFKPAPVTYIWALRELGVKPEEALMVAAHAWDVAGAKAQGLQTAFITRPGAYLYPNVERPDYVVKDVQALSKILAALKAEQDHAMSLETDMK